jgi:DNA-binding GntR family transcriptional regulator
VRMAISELVRTGYLKKRQGKGTFVTSAVPDLGIAMKTRLTENILGEGVIAKKEVIERGVKGMSGDIRSILLFNGKDDENSDLFYILCRRLVDGEPAYLEESFVPLAVLPGIQYEDVCEKPFYDLIQEKSIRKIFKVVQTIEVSEITAEAASLLRVYESTPALLLHRLLIGSDARPIAYTRLLGTGKKYKIQTEFERIK